jgi:hypothetical protein
VRTPSPLFAVVTFLSFAVVTLVLGLMSSWTVHALCGAACRPVPFPPFSYEFGQTRLCFLSCFFSSVSRLRRVEALFDLP